MDAETGEFYLDLETGEISEAPTVQNVETGEYEYTRTFKIPSYYYRRYQERKEKTNCTPRKADPLESQLITAAIFLLPTMIFFHPIMLVFVCVIEIFLHTRIHRKNKELEDLSFYYQSPLHGLTKEVCARCKDEKAKNKIAKLQDKQHEKFKNYIKRVVT
ncbi:uncharacterized protein LOC126881090 [Diabrotica virgifera virgifera]|uniref:Uncharacterized protein n=1 Tax=Diabrotica virgifera virgifera TaxID=50390 RepID=A0ABM5JT20_DIAVI|nr:uncharacterized protein LOC126881090 [Diabrotica virgifera virgifera]